MPEDLTPADVAQYTRGRLSADDPETLRALNAALAKARRWCGWHVSPVRTETLTLDGSGSLVLEVPTLKIVSLTSVSEGGTAVDLAEVHQSHDTPGLLVRTTPWTCEWGAVEVTLTHGFTAAEAQDWREAVLAMVDQATLNVGTGAAGSVVSQKVDDVEYSWSNAALGTTALDSYRLLPV
ncbi:hypothetical protein [Mycobacterium sp. IS-1556]|uniref:hypothetical protein n=1 Tax=Mycobacterium sp. IS-1556 TaxID=1772276 RepID=UPI0007416457|nr:hypothetical protein [Mycobacterium sp. IS-1556]KUH90624.1 hypothetical protein AU187_24440 [Mycobacterium sp. IS-1556]